MAEKRMISKTIVDSDAFLDMPQTTQNLYFHLNVRADDEGFLDAPKKVMRSIGSNQNDLELLLDKNYIIAFESGVIVIKHWKLHNTIRKDRLKKTLYIEEKSKLLEKKNGAYTTKKPDVNQPATRCRHSIVQTSIESSKEDSYTIEGNKEESFLPKAKDPMTIEDIKYETLKKKLKDVQQCYDKIKAKNPESEELDILRLKIDDIETEMYTF
jgi:hypothetical protein